MKKRFVSLTLFLLLVSGTFLSCEDNPPTVSNPTELITTFIYILTPENGQGNLVLSFEDLDGEGGNPPSYLTDPISANTTYRGVIQALDKTLNPIVDITPELEDESEDHQVFFEPGSANLTIEYTDMDANGNPIGLKSRLVSGDPGTGTLKITLRHRPEKSAQGVSGGDITNAGGQNDIEANFPITIQ